MISHQDLTSDKANKNANALLKDISADSLELDLSLDFDFGDLIDRSQADFKAIDSGKLYTLLHDDERSASSLGQKRALFDSEPGLSPAHTGTIAKAKKDLEGIAAKATALASSSKLPQANKHNDVKQPTPPPSKLAAQSNSSKLAQASKAQALNASALFDGSKLPIPKEAINAYEETLGHSDLLDSPRKDSGKPRAPRPPSLSAELPISRELEPARTRTKTATHTSFHENERPASKSLEAPNLSPVLKVRTESPVRSQEKIAAMARAATASSRQSGVFSPLTPSLEMNGFENLLDDKQAQELFHPLDNNEQQRSSELRRNSQRFSTEEASVDLPVPKLTAQQQDASVPSNSVENAEAPRHRMRTQDLLSYHLEQDLDLVASPQAPTRSIDLEDPELKFEALNLELDLNPKTSPESKTQRHVESLSALELPLLHISSPADIHKDPSPASPSLLAQKKLPPQVSYSKSDSLVLDDDFLSLFNDAMPALEASSKASLSKVQAIPKETAAAPASAVAPSAKGAEASSAAASPAATTAKVPAAAPQAKDEKTEMLFDLAALKNKTPAVNAENKARQDLQERRQRRQRRQKLVLALAGFIIVAVCAVLLLKAFLPKDEPATVLGQKDSAPISLTALSWEQLYEDKVEHYQNFIQAANQKLRANDTEPSEKRSLQGQIMAALVLANLRFPSNFLIYQEPVDAQIQELAQNCQEDWCKLGLSAWLILRREQKAALDELALPEPFQSLIQTSEVPELKASELKLENEATLKAPMALLQAGLAYLQASHQGLRVSQRKSLLDRLEAALPMSEDNSLSAWLKIQAQLMRADFNGANDSLKQILERGQHYPWLKFYQARLLYQKGAYSEAYQALQALYPEHKTLGRDSVLFLKLYAELTSIHLPWDESSPILFDLAKTEANRREILAHLAMLCAYYSPDDSCLEQMKNLADSAEPHSNYRRALIFALFVAIQAQNERAFQDGTLNAQIKYLIDSINTQLDAKANDPELWLILALAYYIQDDIKAAINASLEIERYQNNKAISTFFRTLENYENAEFGKKQAALQKMQAIIDDSEDIQEAIFYYFVMKRLQKLDLLAKPYQRFQSQFPQSLPLAINAFNMAILLEELETAKANLAKIQAKAFPAYEQQYALALLTAKSGDLNGALVQMSALIAAAPKNPHYLLSIGKLYLESKRFDSALQFFAMALDEDANLDLAQFYRGQIFYQLANYEEALQAFQEAALIQPNQLSYSLWIAKTQLQLRQQNDALRAFSRVITNHANLSDNDKNKISREELAEAYFGRAQVYQYNRRRSAAKKDFEKSLDLDPNHSGHQLAYATFLYENAKLQAALKLLNQIEAQKNMTPVGYCLKGLILLKLDQRTNALKALEAARDAGYADLEDPGIAGIRDPAQIYEQLAYLYRDSGMRSQARQAFQLYLEKAKNMSHSDRREIIRERDKL